MELKGKATILFDRDNGMSIELEDASSGITIHASLDCAATIAALSRQVSVDCTIDYPERLDLIGKKCEVKTVLIEKTWEGYKTTREVIEDECKKQGFLVDGWELWQDGLRTQQNVRGKHSVVIERYV